MTTVECEKCGEVYKVHTLTEAAATRALAEWPGCECARDTATSLARPDGATP